MKDLAIVALTPNGLALGQRLAAALGRGEVVSAQRSASVILTDLFSTGRPLVCIMALGIVVRILGPLTRDKTREPAVVVLDEAGRFAVSVLGGHVGGANELARQVAAALGAAPVITTASDVLELPAVDLIGHRWGWTIDSRRGLKAVAAAVVRGEPIGVYQDAGRRDWWQEFGPWPPSFVRLAEWPPERTWAGLIAISDRKLAEARCGPSVVIRPRSLVLGVGCRRGVPCAKLDAGFQRIMCRTHGYSAKSLAIIATAWVKIDEQGLLAFAAKRGVPLRCFSQDELASVKDLPTPSAKVRETIGIDGVAEPAALLAAGAAQLLVCKQTSDRQITMALARREDA